MSLIHGARAVMRWAQRHDHAQSQWLLGLKDRRGVHRTIVAFANTTHRDVGKCRNAQERVRHMARIAWAVTTSEKTYNRDLAFRPQAKRATTTTAAA